MPLNYTPAAIDELSISDLAQLDAATLADLQLETNAALARARRWVAKITDALDEKYSADLRRALDSTGKQSGIVRFNDGALTVEADAKRKIEWDQDGLRKLAKEIAGGGMDPASYIVTKTELTVREAAYKTWPISVRAEFDKCRIVRSGKPSYSFKMEK